MTLFFLNIVFYAFSLALKIFHTKIAWDHKRNSSAGLNQKWLDLFTSKLASEGIKLARLRHFPKKITCDDKCVVEPQGAMLLKIGLLRYK